MKLFDFTDTAVLAKKKAINRNEYDCVARKVEKVYLQYKEYYFEARNPDLLISLFSEDVTNIGSGSDEFVCGIDNVMAIFERDKQQCPSPIEYEESNLKIIPVNPFTGIILVEFDLRTEINNLRIPLIGYRLSLVISKYKKEWLINHIHFSKGEVDLNAGESFPLKEIEERNKILEQTVQNKTNKLHELNQKLRIANKDINEINQRFESIFENVNDGIIVLDWSKGAFYMLNKRFCDLLGYDKDEMTKLWLIDIIPEEYYKETVEKLHLQYTGNIQGAEEMPFLTKDKVIKYFDVSSRTISFDHNNYCVSILRDITEKKAAMDMYKEMEVSRKASETKDLFLANISHEIRTPVTGIIGMTEVLKRSELNSEQQEYLDIIKESSNVLLDIINDLLDISKIEAGKLEIREEVFTLHDLLWNMKTLFEGRACRKNLNLKLSYSTNIQEKIKADKTRVEQVLMNLLTNAIKYTEAGSVELSVSAKDIDFYSSQIKVEVKDTGIGIAENDINKLFKKFEQLDKSYTRTTCGTGLGLFICKELTKLLGGDIGVFSKPNVGSTFWFTFKGSRIYLDEPVMKHAEITTENEDLGFKVLIVDDKDVNITVIKLMLESAGCIVDTAINGEDAITAFKPGYHQIIFMDIMMPVLDGISSMKMIKKLHKNPPPIIALTANAMEGDAQTYMSKGFSDYMPKPAIRADLVNMMLKWVSS